MQRQTAGLESVLASWPTSLPRKGVAVTAQGEQIVFANFSVSSGCVLLERTTPDAMGGRVILLPIENLAVFKFTDTLSEKAIKDLGFHR